jgi:hypothetical protein
MASIWVGVNGIVFLKVVQMGWLAPPNLIYRNILYHKDITKRNETIGKRKMMEL